ncbi:MAG: T9SS type A sorting domain-containing protein, partial [Bacteroidales bacterium]|nr:T9SS type A sorting domain-containing protein [Bacteroidales bacterium]
NVADKSYIKITDINGTLVYNTQANGGQAVWNGKNLKGQRVKTGVYLVFITNENGTEKEVTKIMFLN